MEENQPHRVEHDGWATFEQYAIEDGISLEHSDDWLPWWECFLEGWSAGIKWKDNIEH